MRAADTASRIWGLLVLAIGLWFFADVTLGYDMPSIAWRDVSIEGSCWSWTTPPRLRAIRF